MVELDNACCICGCAVRRRIGGVPAYYCAACFSEHETDILTGTGWVKYLMNAEKTRRKRRNRLIHAGISLWVIPLEGYKYA